jgi:hypothetical protein
MKGFAGATSKPQFLRLRLSRCNCERLQSDDKSYIYQSFTKPSINRLLKFRVDTTRETEKPQRAVFGSFASASVTIPGVSTSGSITGWLWPGVYSA